MTKQHRKTFIKRIIMLLLVALSVLPLFLSNIQASDGDPYISVSGNSESRGAFFANENNLLTVTIKLNNASDSSVEVRYYAQDQSAICEAGDYYLSNGVITAQTTISDKVAGTHKEYVAYLSSENSSVSVTFYVSKLSYSTYTDGTYNDRFFNFVISSVDGCAMPEKTSYKCAMFTSNSMQCINSSNGYYVKYYGKEYKVEQHISGFDKGDSCVYKKNLITGTSEIKVNNTTYTLQRDEAFNYIINSGYGYIYTKMYYYGDCKVHNWHALRFETFADNSGASDDKDTKIGYWYKDACYEDGGYSDVNTYVKYGDYARLDRAWGDAIRIVGKNWSTINRWGDATFTTYFSDDDLPQITGSYVDSSSINHDGSIRVMVRFNEPVQLKNPDNVSIIGKANGTETVKLTYCAGNYTDTLVFEANLFNGEFVDKNTQINYIYLDSFENVNTLGDFGLNIRTRKNNYFDTTDNSNIFGAYHKATCDIDLRIPTISNIVTYNNQNATQSRSVELKLSQIRNADLYYSWSTSKDEEFESYKDYDSHYELVGDKNDNVSKTFTIDNVSGEYYLHLYIVTAFAKTLKVTLGRNGNIETQTEGGYLLDNTKPVINSQRTEYDSLTSKVFTLNVGDGKAITDSGVESVYVSVKLSDDSPYSVDVPIYTNSSTVRKDMNDDIIIGGMSNVYVCDSTLKYVYSTTSINQTPYASTGGDAVSLLFSSKEKAKEYFLTQEYRDFSIFTVGTTITGEEVSTHLAYGEATQVADGQTWIRYKNNEFDFDGSYSESEWSYYYYGGNKSSLDLTTALKNTLLKTAVETNAATLAENGKIDNVYKLGYIQNGVVSLPQTQTRRSVTISSTNRGVSFSNAITFTDPDIVISSLGGEFTVKLDYNSAVINCSENDFKYVYIGFYVVDQAGNSSKNSITYQKFKFDTRTLFTCNDSCDSSALDTSITDANAYQVNSKFTFTATLNTQEGESGSLGIDKIMFRGVEIAPVNYSKYFDIVQLNELQISLIPKMSGYLEVYPKLVDNTTVKVHDPFCYYISNALIDDTTNYQNALASRLLVGEMYMINLPYTYMDKQRVIHKISYASSLGYDTDESYAYFSSIDVAKEYIRYMELQDMTLVTLDKNMADSLNSGTESMYLKAPDEDTIAQQKQVWIRYKIYTWTPDSVETAWVYYFHNDTGNMSIQTNKLGKYLEPALENVVKTILTYGMEVNLVGSNYSNEYGAPYVDQKFLHTELEGTSVTKNNDVFASRIEYNGDANAYNGSISKTINGISEDVTIQTNTVLNKLNGSILYYCYYTGQTLSSMVYSPLSYNHEQTYREALNAATGVYFIREFDIYGVHEYKIYIDNLAPQIEVAYTTPTTKDPLARTLDEASNGTTIGCKTFTITDLNTTNELDEYAYVLLLDDIGKIQATYFVSQIISEKIKLPNGISQLYVSDRSGNSFLFGVNCSDEDLKFSVGVDASNDYVEVTMNRDASEIVRYQVFINGSDTPLDSVWSGSRKTTEKYKESGYYHIYVKDIYGNEAEENGESGGGLSFERPVPNVIWSYLEDEKNESYVPYDAKTTTAMTMYKSLGNVYYISTSRPLKFRMNQVYKYEITGISESKLVKLNLNKDVLVGSVEDWRKTKQLTDFTVSFWYDEYPDVKVTYIVTTDIEAPELTITYNTENWINSEQEILHELTNTTPIGTVYNLNTVEYKTNKTVIRTVPDGGYVNSNLIAVSAKDLSGIKHLSIFLKEFGKTEEQLLVDIETTDDEIENITLSRYGYYRIVVTDIFNNEATHSFTNQTTENIVYTVDGNITNNRLHETIYGNSTTSVKMLVDGLLTLQVTDNGIVYTYLINVCGGVATLQEYKVIETEQESGVFVKSFDLTDVLVTQYYGTQAVTYSKEIFSVEDPGYNSASKNYLVFSKYNEYGIVQDGFNLYISYDVDQLLTFTVECVDADVFVTARASFEDGEPYLVKTELSKSLSDVAVIDTASNEITIENITYLNKSFTLSDNINANITLIEFAYSANNDFVKFETIYPYTKTSDQDTRKFKAFNTNENGFYKIKITNKYGNVNTYLFNKSDIFQVLDRVEYADGTTYRLDANNTLTIYSNSKVMIEAYAPYVEYRIVKNNIQSYTTNGNDHTSYFELVLDQPGTYVIEVVDLKFGNRETKYVEIVDTTLTYQIDLLTGFNQNAMKKFYTNNLITINKDLVNSLNIKYIEIDYNDTQTILYDSLNKEVDLNKDSLINCIGLLGSGTYKVIFRDQYGTKLTQDVNYAQASPFTVTRKISSSKDDQILELTSQALLDGVWSNGSFGFTTTCDLYEIYVNDSKNYLPLTLEFATTTGNATIPYDIYYRDEYGFEYTFKATLDRRNVQVGIDPSVNYEIIENVITTKEAIKVNYSLGDCMYYLDNGTANSYENGSALYKDGVYRFIVQDKAGNQSTLVVKKDSVTVYQFIDKATGYALVDGEAVNTNNVYLSSTENIYVDKVYKDGEKLEEKDMTSFKEHGHYYVFLHDDIGNQSVFEFTIIAHNVNKLHYETPNTYVITALWFSSADGTFANYLNSGCVNHNYKDGKAISSILDIAEDGDYQVTMTSDVYKSGLTFTFTIDTSTPKVNLVGCNEGETTLEDITLKGCQSGDTVYIYKDNKLIKTEVIQSLTGEAPTITEGGKYTIVIENVAGNTTTLSFEKTYILNTSGSVLIMIIAFAVIAGIITGVVLRNKQKFDE